MSENKSEKVSENKSEEVSVNVNVYDPNSKTSETTNIVFVKNKEFGHDLKHLRGVLHTIKGLESNELTYAFCTSSGSKINDTTTYLQYKNLIDSDGGNEESKPHTLYLRGKDKTELNEVAKNFLAKGVNLDLEKNKPELLNATVNQLSSAYNHADYKATAGSGKVKTPANMTEEDWIVVLRHTNFLSGHRLVFGKGSDGQTQFRRMERAPYKGFDLVPRDFQTLDVSRDKNIDANFLLAIPRFVVEDDSYVDVFETQSDISKSMSRSSFSKTDIEASAGGGAFGFNAAVSGGFARSDSEALSKQSSSSSKVINITYNFPRVVLHLDENNLKMSEELKKEVEKVKTENSVNALLTLHQKFGHFFATRIELGGKLYSSEDLSTFGEATVEEAASAMKASASASFSGPAVQISASYSKENQENTSSSNKISQLQRSVSWQAQGGDTLLCNNPPAWCSTVAPFDNWRVVKQEDVFPLGDFISKFSGYESIPRIFGGIAESTRKTKKVYFRLKVDNSNDYLSIVLDGGNIEKGIEEEFKALARDVQRTSPEWKAAEHRTWNFAKSACLSKLGRSELFETVVETYLDRPAEMTYSEPIFIRQQKSQEYLAATREIPAIPGKLFIFPSDHCEYDAIPFIFNNHPKGESKAAIKNGDTVLLRILDHERKFKGYLSRGNNSNTIVSKPYHGEDGAPVLFFKIELVEEKDIEH